MVIISKLSDGLLTLGFDMKQRKIRNICFLNNTGYIMLLALPPLPHTHITVAFNSINNSEFFTKARHLGALIHHIQTPIHSGHIF
jgi:hypothetical protein